jgi:hypothetical protein
MTMVNVINHNSMCRAGNHGAVTGWKRWGGHEGESGYVFASAKRGIDAAFESRQRLE